MGASPASGGRPRSPCNAPAFDTLHAQCLDSLGTTLRRGAFPVDRVREDSI